MVPGQDSVEVCRALRARGCPSLMLTAKDKVEDRIEGLKSGADDYLTKPFIFGELIARVEARLRRHVQPSAPEELRMAGLRLDTIAKIAWRNDRQI